MIVTQISIGRFHHFHLARQMEMRGLLDCIWTGYPRIKLNDEQGIPINKIKTYPWLYSLYMARARFGLSNWQWLNKQWLWWAQEMLDYHVASKINQSTILIALSGTGLHTGTKVQQLGGRYICDRGSSHIRFQDQILREEYARWGLVFPGIDPRVVEKEEAEYIQADCITVPSEFVRRSFIEMGVPSTKISKIVYGARLDRFYKIADPPADVFRVLWVGSVSIRKGFIDLLDAFALFKHPNKELLVVGAIDIEIKALIATRRLDKVIFKGNVPNQDLPEVYNSSHVFVLPSIEEGLAMVQGESLACGCPVIATPNSGSEDLFANGREGFIIPIRSPKHIAEKLQQLADDYLLRLELSDNALKRVGGIGGWNTYGNSFSELVRSL
jgi:glycosyltransferase involved in cell wall biosynthesis